MAPTEFERISMVEYHWLIDSKTPKKGPRFSEDEWDSLIGEYEKAEQRGTQVSAQRGAQHGK